MVISSSNAIALNLSNESDRYWIIYPSYLSKIVNIRLTPVSNEISIAFFISPFFLLLKVT